jgi:dGTPase
LLPRDRRAAIENLPTEQGQKRAVCDFIADMTDTYATEFYGRLMSTDGETIYKPV